MQHAARRTAPRGSLIPKALLDAQSGGVFFLHGQDDYRKRRAARFLLDRYLDPATRDFNLDRLEGSEVTLDRLASTIETPPMMAEWRIVHLIEAEALAGSPRARKVILKTAQSPPPGLVLIVQATVPARSKARFYSDLARAAHTAEFKPVSEDALPGWLIAWADEELKTALDPQAAQALVGGVGTDLGVLVQEIRKLSEVVASSSTIDLETVRKAGIRLPTQDRWAWFDLVGNRRIDDAVRTLPVLFQQGETAVGLVIGLATQILRIGVALEGGTAALNRTLPPYQRFLARRIAGQARRWTRGELADAVRELCRLDQLLKASAIDDDVLVESWLMSCRPR